MRDYLMILNKLIRCRAESLNDDLIMYISADGKEARFEDFRLREQLYLNRRNFFEFMRYRFSLMNAEIETKDEERRNVISLWATELQLVHGLTFNSEFFLLLLECIENPTSLQIFDVSGTGIKSLPENIGNLKGLQSLNAKWSNLTSLPERIGDLTNLKRMNVKGTKLISLPESIGTLKNLKSLDVSGTNLISLPESIGKLTSLQSLNISNTQLTFLPESIGTLKNLKSLDVSGTSLISLPESIGKLTSLQSLNISNTQLTFLPESIDRLTNLQRLDASNTNLIALPESINNLTSLQRLEVDRTQLTTLPKSIKDLKELVRIDVSGTNIKSINKEVWRLPALKQVFIENLLLERLSGDILDTNLNFLTYETSEYDIGSTNGIYIHGLFLSKQPVSLFYQKRELIEQYFSEEMVSINSAKIIFLGDGEVGKTYTLKRLLNNGIKEINKNTYPTVTTHGVLIKPYHLNDVDKQYDIKLWDFGGQQIMHSMHRCFLTERSCYVVMLSTRTDRDLLEQARYWLRTVNSFAPNAPVIVLVNQWTNNLIRVDEFRLREEFKNIKDFLYFSVVEADDELFLTLRDSIMEQVHQLDCYGMEFPKSWYGLMTDLEDEAESQNYISKTKYLQMCFERGLKFEDDNEEGIYEWLLDWFNDLGICFSYHKNTNNQRLNNYELLNPQWLTRAAYVLVNNGESIADNGILTKEQIKRVLTNTEPLDFDDLGRVSYETFEIDFVLEILRKFQISYQLPNGRELIPVLCCANSSGSVRPDWFITDKMQHTSYEFQYEYLPDTIIHRLMIFCYQSHYLVRDRWRKGMRVDLSNEYSGLTAVIDTGNENHSISIDIYSDGRIPCWEFLSKLREEILQINAELNLKAKDYINMETNGAKDRFSVEAVLKKRARGWNIIQADNYDGDYEISDILGSAYGPSNTAAIVRVTELRKSAITSDVLNQILDYLSKLNNRTRIDAIMKSIIKALEGMQADRTYYRNQGNSNELENSRNRFVSSQLRAAGYNCSDHQTGGISATGNAPGERDFVVRDEYGSEFLIYEGLNLKATNNNYIDNHLTKLLDNYNPLGLPYGVLTTYLECDRDKFKSISDRYRNHISNYAPMSYRCIGTPRDVSSNGQFLACMEMQYETGGLDFYIYHIIVRIAP